MGPEVRECPTSGERLLGLCSCHTTLFKLPGTAQTHTEHKEEAQGGHTWPLGEVTGPPPAQPKPPSLPCPKMQPGHQGTCPSLSGLKNRSGPAMVSLPAQPPLGTETAQPEAAPAPGSSGVSPWLLFRSTWHGGPCPLPTTTWPHSRQSLAEQSAQQA